VFTHLYTSLYVRGSQPFPDCGHIHPLSSTRGRLGYKGGRFLDTPLKCIMKNATKLGITLQTGSQ